MSGYRQFLNMPTPMPQPIPPPQKGVDFGDFLILIIIFINIVNYRINKDNLEVSKDNYQTNLKMLDNTEESSESMEKIHDDLTEMLCILRERKGDS